MTTVKKAAPKKAAAKKTASKKTASKKVEPIVVKPFRIRRDWKVTGKPANGRFETSDPAVINSLRNSRCNADYKSAEPSASMVGPALEQSNGNVHWVNTNDLTTQQLEELINRSGINIPYEKKVMDEPKSVEQRPSFLALAKSIKANLDNQAKLLDVTGEQLHVIARKLGHIYSLPPKGVRPNPSEEYASLYGQLDYIDVVVNRHSEIIDVIFHHLENLTDGI